MIKPDQKNKMDRIVAASGLPEGMSASRPVDRTKYYVIAPSQGYFTRWVKKTGKNLQSCNYIGTIEGMYGLSFESPEVELVILAAAHHDKGEEFYQEACRLISRYCLDKRVRDCKHERVD